MLAECAAVLGHLAARAGLAGRSTAVPTDLEIVKVIKRCNFPFDPSSVSGWSVGWLDGLT